MSSMEISRRKILASVPSTVLLGVAGQAVATRPRRRPKIAALISEYRKYSHGQNIVDRIVEGYGWEDRHHRPAMDVVSLYMDQFPENDLSRERESRIPGLKIYPTIAEALTLGGEQLAVDGVLLIAEHGRYPKNKKGQTLFPRYEFFQQVADVFRASGRTAPVFVDKHLSWNWDWAQQMVKTSRSLGFPMMAGSSLPVARRLPSCDMPWGAEIKEVVSVGVGNIDSYDFHSLEAVQCLVERRRGGETGVVSIQALQGEKVWEAQRAGSWEAGGWDPELFEACLCRSFSLMPARENFTHLYPTYEQMPQLVNTTPYAYRYQYADGTRATILLLEGIVQDITVAARLKGEREPFSQLFYMGAGHEMQPNFFNSLVHHIEHLFTTGQASYPIERTLLTTGLTAAGVDSIWLGQKPLATPHLGIQYQPRRESTFRRT